MAMSQLYGYCHPAAKQGICRVIPTPSSDSIESAVLCYNNGLIYYSEYAKRYNDATDGW